MDYYQILKLVLKRAEALKDKPYGEPFKKALTEFITATKNLMKFF